MAVHKVTADPARFTFTTPEAKGTLTPAKPAIKPVKCPDGVCRFIEG